MPEFEKLNPITVYYLDIDKTSVCNNPDYEPYDLVDVELIDKRVIRVKAHELYGIRKVTRCTLRSEEAYCINLEDRNFIVHKEKDDNFVTKDFIIDEIGSKNFMCNFVNKYAYTSLQDALNHIAELEKQEEEVIVCDETGRLAER